MVFFKQKISVNDFCIPRCDFIFSFIGKKFMDDFLNNSGDDKLLNIDPKEIYYKHFEAIYLQLLGVTIAKNYIGDISLEWIRIRDDYLRSKGYDDIIELILMYSSIFGSSYVDGIKEIVLFFIEKLTGSKPNENCLKYCRDRFYSILSSFYDEITKVKLVPSKRHFIG
jgi:hypothetical protein